MNLSIVVLLAGICCLETVLANSPEDVSNILNQILDKYDKRVRPDYGEKPVDVNITMYILRGLEWSEKNMNWKVQFYFRQNWQDRRLAYNFPGISNITVGPETAKIFWQPDTFFPGATTTKLKSDENVFFRIRNDGTILSSVMVTSETFCPMDLTLFPHDNQRCSLDMESYGHTSRDIKYRFQDNLESIGFDPNIQFEDKKMISTDISYKDIVLSSGHYSRIALIIFVTRKTGYFCRQFYFPAIFFAVFTWLTFWVPDSSRLFRGIFVMCSLMAYWLLYYRAGNCLPRLDYTTRLEQYTTTCLLLSLLTLIEYVVVLSLSKRLEDKDQAEEKNGEANKEIVDAESGKNGTKVASYVNRSVKYVLTLGQHRHAPAKIDLVSRIAYPIIFVIFNISYWASLASSR